MKTYTKHQNYSVQIVQTNAATTPGRRTCTTTRPTSGRSSTRRRAPRRSADAEGWDIYELYSELKGNGQSYACDDLQGKRVEAKGIKVGVGGKPGRGRPEQRRARLRRAAVGLPLQQPHLHDDQAVLPLEGHRLTSRLRPAVALRAAAGSSGRPSLPRHANQRLCSASSPVAPPGLGGADARLQLAGQGRHGLRPRPASGDRVRPSRRTASRCWPPTSPTRTRCGRPSPGPAADLPLRIVVNCAGIGPAGRHPLEVGSARPRAVPPGRRHQPGRHVQRPSARRRGHRADRAPTTPDSGGSSSTRRPSRRTTARSARSPTRPRRAGSSG